jgi:RNA polymerase sigma-70 factor (ECF subfamily)
MPVRIGESAAAGTSAVFTMVDFREKALPRPSIGARAIPSSDGSSGSLDEVLDRYARGQDVVFDDLYRRAAPRIRGFLLRLCGDRPLADDLTQEAFLRIHRARGSFEQGAAALPWMYAIARNTFLDHTRRARARGAIEAEVRTQQRARVESPPDTRGDEALAAREMLDVVRATLAQMSVVQREAFVLIRFEGLSVSEVAQVVGASEAAVKIRAFRAYEALRAALGKDGR